MSYMHTALDAVFPQLAAQPAVPKRVLDSPCTAVARDDHNGEFGPTGGTNISQGELAEPYVGLR